MTSTKYIAWMYTREKHFDRSHGMLRKASDGMRHRDQGEYHISSLFTDCAEICMSRFEEGTWAAWLLRPAEAARHRSRGV